MARSLDDVPDEILEYIFDLLSPYQDLDSCKLVSTRWNCAMKRVVERKQRHFYQAIRNKNLIWESRDIKISSRHSHAACYSNGVMYVYGGCSAEFTSFNDLYALDLTQREFNRVTTHGRLPSPKTCTTLCAYKNKLYLYGGMAHPSRTTPFLPPIIFNELHIFDTEANKWETGETSESSGSFGHSATVHNNLMVVFGGITDERGSVSRATNNLLCLNLDTHTWHVPICSSKKPGARFAHSQIFLDNYHLLIIGGNTGMGLAFRHCDDVWMLSMKETPWAWSLVTVANPQWSAPQLWCRPVARVGHYLVAFSRFPGEESEIRCSDHVGDVECHENSLVEENINGRRGQLGRSKPLEPAAAPQSTSHDRDKRRPRWESRKEMRLAHLAKYEKKFEDRACSAKLKKKVEPCAQLKMNLYVADLSEVISNKIITWQQPRYSCRNPEDRLYFSIVVGNSELIMLGGREVEPVNVGCIVKQHPLSFALAPKKPLFLT